MLRLRSTIRFANRFASVRIRSIVFLLSLYALLFAATSSSATIYYVSESTGNDANGGTSTATAWQTIAHVNTQTFQPGDSVLFKRGDVWNESLAPPSSGSAGNPITFDAYGTGAAPNLTGYRAVPASAWVLVTGECLEGSAACELQHDQFLFVRIDLGAEGFSCLLKFDGTVGFLFREWICVRLFSGKSGDLL